MANNVKTNSEKPTKKKKQKKTKEIILILSAAALLCYILVAIIIIILNQPPKSYEEVEKILYNNGYKTYFTLKANTYDESGQCYKYSSLEKNSCKREVGIENQASISIKIINGNFNINTYYNVNTNGIPEISLEKKISDDKESIYYDYSFDLNGENDYLFYSELLGEHCYVINKTEETDSSTKRTICNNDKKNILLSHKDEAENTLKNLNLSKQDLFVYFNEYAKKYVKPKYDVEKTNAKIKLPYEAVQKYIKNAGYIIEKRDDYIVIRDNSLFTFLFPFSDNKTTGLVFEEQIHKNYSLHYFKEFNSFVGGDSDQTCSYVVENNTSSKNDVLSGYCTSDDKKTIEILLNSFKMELDSIQITRDELFDFVEEYYKKN